MWGHGKGRACVPAEKQLAKLLEEGGGAGKSQPAYGFGSAPEQGAWAQGGLLLEQSTSSSAAAEDAAQRMQDLLQQGEQPAALKSVPIPRVLTRQHVELLFPNNLAGFVGKGTRCLSN